MSEKFNPIETVNLINESILDLKENIESFINEKSKPDETLNEDYNKINELNKFVDDQNILKYVEDELTINLLRSNLEHNINELESFFNNIENLNFLYTTLKNYYLSITMKDMNEMLNLGSSDDVDYYEESDVPKVVSSEDEFDENVSNDPNQYGYKG